MAYEPLWKYCTAAHTRDFLLSLGLFPGRDWPAQKQLACLYAVANHPQRHYHAVKIPKRDGTHRRLDVPDALLKGIQRSILRHALAGLSIAPCACAYRAGMAVRDNAAPHTGKARVLKLDIADFFGSISFVQVYAHVFPAAYFPPAARGLLTSLCCYRDCLPQGAPTSPAISNLVMKPFDEEMMAYCHAHGIEYTRYCDDMTFSGDFDAMAVVRKVRLLLGRMGMALRDDKTRLLGRESRQLVTGVVVNRHPQAPQDARRQLRQAVYYCRRYGVASHLAKTGDTRYLPLGEEGITRYLQSLLGRVSHVLHLNPQDAAFRQMKAWLAQALRQREADLRAAKP